MAFFHFRNIRRTYEKLPPVGQILIFVVLFLIVAGVFRHVHIEGMSSNNMLFYQNIDAYDEFYADIYDSLVYNDTKNKYEIQSILGECKTGEPIQFVDLGCGTGHHVAELKSLGVSVLGVDASNAMINKSKELHPEIQDAFRVGDITNTYCVPHGYATHLMCLYFTFYYIKNKREFFSNCFSWLAPGGYLILHLVNRENFDPILPSGNPLFIVSPQKYAKERITTTRVKFTGFQYEANFRNDKKIPEIACFDEKFRFPNGKVRRQEQQLYMETLDEITQMALESGFTVHSVVDLVKCAYEYQYLYIFKKLA